MSVATSQPEPQPAEKSVKAGFNRFDSPWFNPKFLIGLGMILLIVLMAPIGPIFWDTDLAKFGKAPLNLPPAWFADPNAELAAEGASSAAQSNSASSVDSDDAGEGTASTASSSAGDTSGSVTGGNPLAQSSADDTSGSVTGGNPLAQSSADDTSGSVTGGNPLAQSSADDTSGSVTGGNPLAPSQSSNSTDGAADEDAVEAEESATSAPVAAPTVPRRPRSRFGTPTWDHPFGTEGGGRDMLAVLLVGAPRSLWIGIIAAGIGMIVGITLGFSAGFLGGWVDAIIRTISDSFITIPSLAVLIVISSFVSLNNIIYMALLLALFAWPGPTRLLRSQVLSMRERGYVQMARLSGASTMSIMFKEMMPNLLPYLAASFTGNVSGAILAATGLEALGLGPTRIPTLGITIFWAIEGSAILRGMWWWWGIPIVALIVIFTGLFLMTIGLDEIANPRLRGVKAQ